MTRRQAIQMAENLFPLYKGKWDVAVHLPEIGGWAIAMKSDYHFCCVIDDEGKRGGSLWRLVSKRLPEGEDDGTGTEEVHSSAD